MRPPKCIRGHCLEAWIIRVHQYQFDMGRADGPHSGPKTAEVHACRPHAVEIATAPGAPAWLSAELAAHDPAKGPR